MLRDNLVGLIAPMRNSGTQASHDRSSYLENPRPVGAETSLTGNVTSPFQAEPAHDELRPGRPRPISDERVAQLVRKTLRTKPKAATHWSIRQIADETGVSKSTVHRIWPAFGLQPHRQNISSSQAIHFL